MELLDLEKLASKGAKCPANITPPETMLFHTLSALYAKYQLGKISREDAQVEKKQIYKAYERMNTEYLSHIKLCKDLQDIIRNGYNIGGVEVVPSMKGDPNGNH